MAFNAVGVGVFENIILQAIEMIFRKPILMYGVSVTLDRLICQ